MNRRLLSTLACAAACLLAPLGAAAQGRVLRYASAFDPQTMDPHALALLYQTRVVTQVYEGLVNRGKDFKLEPSLAGAAVGSRYQFERQPAGCRLFLWQE